ncbi:hypothetical protein Tco_0408067 [Tanacetum coccineum]
MHRATIGDTSLTRPYIPKVSQTPDISPSIAHFYKPIENRCIHEGEVVDQLYYTSDHIKSLLFLNIVSIVSTNFNEPIAPIARRKSSKQYNLGPISLSKIGKCTKQLLKPISYGMFLTSQFRHVMELYPHHDNGIYNVVDHVMRPLALKQTRRPRSDRGKARHSVSSTFAYNNLGLSSRQEDDDEDDGASRASTPSPTTYLKSLKPLNY